MLERVQHEVEASHCEVAARVRRSRVHAVTQVLRQPLQKRFQPLLGCRLHMATSVQQTHPYTHRSHDARRRGCERRGEEAWVIETLIMCFRLNGFDVTNGACLRCSAMRCPHSCDIPQRHRMQHQEVWTSEACLRGSRPRARAAMHDGRGAAGRFSLIITRGFGAAHVNLPHSAARAVTGTRATNADSVIRCNGSMHMAPPEATRAFVNAGAVLVQP